MRSVLVLAVLLVLGLGQVLLVHVHPAHDAHPGMTASTDHGHAQGSHVHSHVIDAETADLHHLQAIDEGQADLPLRPASTLHAGLLAAAVWALLALGFSPRSGFLIRIPAIRPAARSRPPICLRPAPQGPPC